LIDAGILPRDLPLRVNAVSGYSGGGKSLINQYEQRDEPGWRTRPYALSLRHKHVPEMQVFSSTRFAPIFAPMVGHYRQGMLVQIPLFISELADGVTPATVRDALARRYTNEPFVTVAELGAEDWLEDGFISPTACNDSNNIELMVFGHEEQVLLSARYDNLGKGAAGAAVQNLNLMLGFAETAGLA